MNDTFTTEQRVKLEGYLASHDLSEGLGTRDGACSIAAINLAISGKLTDSIPDCMSKVLGNATIRLQDAIPNEMRNSARYKALLPDMAGTGRAKEKERLAVITDWMWSTVLPQLQPLADEKGFGVEWSNMCRLKTAKAANAANAAAAKAANAAAYAADYAAFGAAGAAGAAADTAKAANAVYADATDTFWDTVDPIGVLERMTYLKGDK